MESEWEMRDAARSGRKRWALGNWDLRWKVTAVLAVPLAVAVGLGVSRISTEFADSNRLAGVAENIEAIPMVTGLSAQTATTAASQMTALQPTQSVVTDKDLSNLDKAITDAEGAASKLDGVEGARASLDNMIAKAKTVRAQGKAVNNSPPDQVIGLIDEVRNDSVHIVETTVGQVSDGAIDAAKLRLVDSLNTRSTLVGQVAAFAEVLRNSPTGIQDVLTAANTERSMLSVLAHRFPEGDTSIADLRAGIDTRAAALSSPEVEAGQIPIGDLKNSLTTSLGVYESVVAKATKDIDNGMNNLVSDARFGAWTYTAVVFFTILAALALAVFVARSMILPLHRLRLAALRVAESDLPHEVSQLRNGASPEEVPLEPMPVRSEEEIGQLARAVDDIHGQALRLASDQAQMRSQVNDMFETLARRSKSLVDHQLSLIEAMEYDEKDPRLLENLFRLDHLAARMRRNGDNLLILAGTRQRRAKSAPIEISDVLRAAISEVEDYERVKLGATPRGSLVEPAASDLAHLFAELLDNALRASPPETDVKFTFAQAHDKGMLIEVADRGIGMPPAEMSDINRRLDQTAEPGPDTARHMGLFVVGRLADRHGLTVRLRSTFDTARDPGVTVTVHVPIGLIVAGKAAGNQGGLGSAQPSPLQQRASGPASMQMRAVTRTPGGNVMVTVDPSASGPIPAADPAPKSGPVRTDGSLPQRSPGTAMASETSAQPSGASLRPPAGSKPGPSTNTPQRGKLAAANLPKRNLPGGPQRPGGPAAPTSEATGSAAGSVLPTRKPPEAGPSREPGAGGLPQRQAPGAAPQREPGAGGLPQREPSAGSGLPQRGSASGGLPQREPGAGGLPQRAPSAGGLPQREPRAGGLPQREPTAAGDLPQREPSAGGHAQREPGAGGLPQREPSAGSGLPQRGSASGGLPQREPSAGGHAQREPGAGGLPQRAPSAGGLPQRDSAQGGLPQRESGSTGLPQRQPTAQPPQRETPSPSGASTEPGSSSSTQSGSSDVPQRDSAATRLPQREPSSGGLPQREPRSGGLPQRDPSAGGLPQRDSASGGLPQRGSHSAELPQRGEDARGEDTAAPSGLPQRQPSGQERPGLPQRDSNAGGAHQRDPDAILGLPKSDSGIGLRRHRSDEQLTTGDPASGADDAGRDPGRHSYKSNPTKTASFFQTRLQPAEETPSGMGTPIFAEMMSAWLSDPSADRSQTAATFDSPGDEGWQAARKASEEVPETKTAAGLPQRNPGGRLVPGAVNGAVDRAPRRDPETIKSSLSRHQQGVRDGRAMKAMNLTGDKGDR
ncbi:hypothetical protein GCM10023318_54120 [Nocardia callitridis]|uniref:histidine kinase n=1 Tax=Nocardia callitridis TaxID=648753 RepID=A0ABP9KUN4_9NOCA